jgi:hypothetical protein
MSGSKCISVWRKAVNGATGTNIPSQMSYTRAKGAQSSSVRAYQRGNLTHHQNQNLNPKPKTPTKKSDSLNWRSNISSKVKAKIPTYRRAESLNWRSNIPSSISILQRSSHLDRSATTPELIEPFCLPTGFRWHWDDTKWKRDDIESYSEYAFWICSIVPKGMERKLLLVNCFGTVKPISELGPQLVDPLWNVIFGYLDDNYLPALDSAKCGLHEFEVKKRIGELGGCNVYTNFCEEHYSLKIEEAYLMRFECLKIHYGHQGSCFECHEEMMSAKYDFYNDDNSDSDPNSDSDN